MVEVSVWFLVGEITDDFFCILYLSANDSQISGFENNRLTVETLTKFFVCK